MAITKLMTTRGKRTKHRKKIKQKLNKWTDMVYQLNKSKKNNKGIEYLSAFGF